MKAVLILYVFVMVCNGNADTKKWATNLSCPGQITESFVMKPGYLKYGLLQGTKILYETGLVTGGLSDTVYSAFAEDPIDEWEQTSEGERSIVEYEAGNHDRMNLRCDYFPKGRYDGRNGGYAKADGRVTLLIPIPDSANFKCTFIQDQEVWKYSANCILK